MNIIHCNTITFQHHKSLSHVHQEYNLIIFASQQSKVKSYPSDLSVTENLICCLSTFLVGYSRAKCKGIYIFYFLFYTKLKINFFLRNARKQTYLLKNFAMFRMKKLKRKFQTPQFLNVKGYSFNFHDSQIKCQYTSAPIYLVHPIFMLSV